MKKMFTLILAGLAYITASAAGWQPKVILNMPNNYDVRIDGRMYKNNDYNLRNLSYGTHTVEVYRVGGGFFGRRKMLVSSEQFTLRNSDVTIDVNQYGRARISEDRFGRKDDGRGWSNDRNNSDTRNTGWNDNNGRNNGGYGQQQYPAQQQYPSHQQYPNQQQYPRP